MAKKHCFKPCSACRLAFEAQEQELQELRERFTKECRTDQLTGLPNERAFRERLEQEAARVLRYGHPLVVCIADIDSLKRVNDVYGHHVGDLMIAEFGRLLSASIRKGDVVARWKRGDEFGIIFPNTNLEKARTLVRRLQSTGLSIDLGSTNIRASASFGYAKLEKGETVHDFLSRVDGLMYVDKASRQQNAVAV